MSRPRIVDCELEDMATYYGKDSNTEKYIETLESEVERLRALWKKETERAHAAEGELLKSRVRLVTEKQERDQLKDQLYKYGCEDVDVIRCLKTLAYEHNHSDAPRYKGLAKRTMDKYVERCASVDSALAQHDAEVIERMIHDHKSFFAAGNNRSLLWFAVDRVNQLRQQAKENNNDH